MGWMCANSNPADTLNAESSTKKVLGGGGKKNHLHLLHLSGGVNRYGHAAHFSGSRIGMQLTTNEMAHSSSDMLLHSASRRPWRS